MISTHVSNDHEQDLKLEDARVHIGLQDGTIELGVQSGYIVLQQDNDRDLKQALQIEKLKLLRAALLSIEILNSIIRYKPDQPIGRILDDAFANIKNAKLRDLLKHHIGIHSRTECISSRAGLIDILYQVE